MSLATDYAGVMSVLVNDDDLKDLMNIATADQTDYRLLLDKYFLQTFISDEFTDDGVCRLLIRSDLQKKTNNEYVKFNGVMFELYVPKTHDYMTAFQTRINQISDRLIVLFNREYINENKLIFTECHEMASFTKYFKRHIIKFEYKKIFR